MAMSVSTESESLAQSMKEESEEKSAEAHRMKKDPKDKEEDSEKKKKKKKEKEHHPISEPSSKVISLHSPPTPPYVGTRIPPSHTSLPGAPPNVGSLDPPQVASMAPAGPRINDVEEDGGTGGGGGNWQLKQYVSNILLSKKEGKLKKALLGLRITAFVFCLISFSVLAAAQDSNIYGREIFNYVICVQHSSDWYQQFMYCLSVNVIGFVYSGLQICDLVKYLITGKHTVNHQLWGYFNFAMDQILTYLLMSASSSAATRAHDLEAICGVTKSVEMANASVALSFLAFMAFALASLVSGCILNLQ